jgi:hypothetical protein
MEPAKLLSLSGGQAIRADVIGRHRWFHPAIPLAEAAGQNG